MEMLFVKELHRRTSTSSTSTSTSMITSPAAVTAVSILQANSSNKKRKIAVVDEEEADTMQNIVAAKDKCLIRILEYLDIKEVCQLGSCNKTLWKAHKNELSNRKEHWMKGTSKSWNVGDVEYNATKFADDGESWNIIKTGLDETFQRPYGTSETHFFDTVTAWSSPSYGWSKFLYTRETLARSLLLPSSLLQVTGDSRPIQFLATPTGYCNMYNKVRATSSCQVEPILICDIHCDDDWVWSGIHPVRKTDFGRMEIEIDGKVKSITAIYPESMKTVGDDTDVEATIHTLDHGYRPNKYLLSMNPNDTRVWSFSLSIVSPACSETLISQTEFIPQDVMRNQLNDTWVPYSGRGSNDESLSSPSSNDVDQEEQPQGGGCSQTSTGGGKKKAEEHLYRSLLAGDTIRCPGIDSDSGRIVPYFSEVDCHFYWDRRTHKQEERQGAGSGASSASNIKKESCHHQGSSSSSSNNMIDGRLHMTLSIFLEDDLIHNMICNPPSSKSR